MIIPLRVHNLPPLTSATTDEEIVVDDDLIDPDYENSDDSTTDDPETGVIREDSPELQGHNMEKNTGRPKKERKRKHPHQTEKIRKLLKDTNKPFISKRGKQNFKLIFEKFWIFGTYDLQTALFLILLVRQKKIKRRWVQEDLRGKHEHHNNISNKRKNQVVQHINSIPGYKSHYRKSQSDREYLVSNMTLDRMYKLYKNEVEIPLSFSFYKKIFYTHFNITRKPLKKNTCYKCNAYSAGVAGLLEQKVLQDDHQLHLKEAEDEK
ncbi:unnamed protein product [Psylliodes chrysocephalus]|uniref:PiggyBac transposable element-derived protein domain-containing protein n=1 Tax=Psylliodes chrysocephalus TaxID=3402493 RepID=A0A9P0G2M8_9CUCU|nr:unnamed protein product [Psylliodes chrysocephala]